MNDRWSPSHFLMLGLLTWAIGLGGSLWWTLISDINGAVVANGRITLQAYTQVLQHPDGGLVAEINVREGDFVAIGDPILRLDDTVLKAQRALLRDELYNTLAQLDLRNAVIAAQPTISYRPELLRAAGTDSSVMRLLSAESKLLELHRSTAEQTRAQWRERERQTEALIEGYAHQLSARKRQLALLSQELEDQSSLYERGLTQASRILALRREIASLEGNIGEIEAATAKARSTIAEYEIERLHDEAEQRQRAEEDIHGFQHEENQLREKLGLIETKLGRLVMRAPMAGQVFSLNVRTVGGVVAAGSDVVSIVPQTQPLLFEVQIDPRQIDRIRSGLPTDVTFPNFNHRTTPRFSGHVQSISPDTITDLQTGAHYYTAEIVLSSQSSAALQPFHLKPGMPFTAFIATGKRSLASILIKPFTDYFSRAMRED